MEREKGWKGERGARSRWRHRVCCLYEEIEGTEQQGESLHHLFMRSEMIPELVCVCVAFGLKRPTVCQWGRDLGLRSRLENAPPTEWTLLLFNEPPLFGFGLLIYRILCKVSRPFRFFLFSPFLVIGAGEGGGEGGRAERIESNFVYRRMESWMETFSSFSPFQIICTCV